LPNETAFAQFYARHVDAIYRLCCIRLENPSDAEDITQETFLRAMRKDGLKDGLIDDDEHAKAWLIVTANNLCKTANTHWTRTQRTTISDWSDAIGVEESPDKETSRTLEAVLNLPDQYKTVIYLYYYEGYSGAEIAKMLQKKIPPYALCCGVAESFWKKI